MLDIHIGVTDAALAQRAIASLGSVEGIHVHQITDVTNIYELRKQGYAMGQSPRVSFLDQDDEIVLPQNLKSMLAFDSGRPYFTNSEVVMAGSKRRLYPRDFKWEGDKSFIAGYVPHQLVVIPRAIAIEAVDTAYTRILSSDLRFLNSTDLAISFEIQLKYGWAYRPNLAYRWYNDTADGMHSRNDSYVEIFNYYKDLLLKKPV